MYLCMKSGCRMSGEDFARSKNPVEARAFIVNEQGKDAFLRQATARAREQKMDMTIQENWALSMARIEEYLQSLEQARRLSATHYEVGGCELLLQPLGESNVGRYAFPRTLVTFSGEEREVSSFHRQFMLRFLTLGG